MSKVNLELTQQQYKKLVETVFLGTWMVNSTRMELDEEFEDVREAVLSKYKEGGMEGEVVHQEEMGIHDLNVEFESNLLETYVEEYDEFSFWDKLVEKLTERQMIAEYGAPQDAMTEEVLERRLQIEDEIGKKLEETGITKLDFTDK